MAHRSTRSAHRLLDEARTMQAGVRMVWGPPAAIADRVVMTRREHRQLQDWIVWLERLVRALVIHIALGLIAGQPAWLVSVLAAGRVGRGVPAASARASFISGGRSGRPPGSRASR